MKDRVLRPDEMPVLWRMSEQEQQTFIRFAERLNWQRAKRMVAWDRGCAIRRLNCEARQKQLKLFDMEEE